MRATVAGLALSLIFVLPPLARADTLAFTIFKEGDPIGHDVYTITKNGDVATVKVAMQTDAKLLFLDFHYRQDRVEVWKGDQLQSLVSDTDDDGRKHHVEAHREANSLVGVADGANKSRAIVDTVPFTLWNAEFLKHTTLLDVSDFDEFKIGVEDKGTEQITVGGRSAAAHRYHLTGDLHWDLWYDADGILLKTAFKSCGYPITFVRE